MGYRPHPPPSPLLLGYDPVRDLPADHLVRFVEQVVEGTLAPARKPVGPGQPAYDPRLCVKVLVYGYATGVRSSRQLERLCQESLAYLYLTRGESPSYGTLCSARRSLQAPLQQVWVHLFAVAEEAGLSRLGRLTVDSSKVRANVSPEAVVPAREYAVVLAELRAILAEAEAADAREAEEGGPHTRLGDAVSSEQMRDILRRVRRRLGNGAGLAQPDPAAEQGGARAGGASEAADRPTCGREADAACVGEGGLVPVSGVGPRMRGRLQQAVAALEQAQEEGRGHVCLSDPDARMMGEGRQKRVQPCYSLEVAVDHGLLVAAGTTQAATDNGRLEALVESATPNEPAGVLAVDADSGYYAGDALARLLERGIDTCVPDSNTAADLHRGRALGTTRQRSQGEVPLTYEPGTDRYVCPQGNELRVRQRRRERGRMLTVYRAHSECTGCALAGLCLRKKGARRRTLKVAHEQEVLQAAQQRFAEPEHQERYRHRADAVETVFGVARTTLGLSRWLLRGAQRVGCEARLWALAYQMRKVHRAWTAA